MTAVASWFRRRVGIATGIAVSGFGLGGLLVPLLVGLIDAYDWRATVIILGIGMLLVLLPLSLVFRHRPEQYGYEPDGLPPEPVAASDDPAAVREPAAEVSVGAGRALRGRTFWGIALVFTCHVLIVTAVITHIMPYLSSVGVPRPVSSVVTTAVPLASIAGRLGFGWLADRFSRKLTTVVGFGMMGIGTLCFAYVGPDTTWLLVPFILLFGPGYGGANVMRPALVQTYFGRKGFGTIFGLMMGINMIGSIAGPPLAGWAFDTWADYQPMWLIMAVVPAAAVLATAALSPVARGADPSRS
jgi:MFS family permease